MVWTIMGDDIMAWLFDGIGTAIITFILGALFGGGAGYCIGFKRGVIKQRQKGRDNVYQIQIGKNDKCSRSESKGRR